MGFYLLFTLQVYIDYVKFYGGPEVQITAANWRSQETAKRKNNDKNINVTANKTATHKTQIQIKKTPQ